MHPFRRGLEHTRALFTRDLAGLWGEGHAGPGNVPLPRYAAGDFPVSEGLCERTTSMYGWIECAEGLIAQLADAIRKVAEGYKKLL